MNFRKYKMILVASMYHNLLYSFTDEEEPQITGCPSDIQVNTSATESFAVVSWTPPMATDNSGVAPITMGNFGPNTSFAIGTSEVFFTAMDGSSNVVTCYFNVTVNGKIPPNMLFFITYSSHN